MLTKISQFEAHISTLPSNVLSLSMSRMQMSHSLFKYTWTVRGGHLFNNAYYKNIVRKTDWFIESEVMTSSNPTL